MNINECNYYHSGIQTRISRWVRALAILGLLFPGLLCGQDFSLDWFSVGSGGGSSSGGGFELSGSAGEPAAIAMSGGGFEMSGGFWSGLTALDTSAGPVTLNLTLSGGLAVLSWADIGVVFILEEAPAGPYPAPWRTLDVTPQLQNGMEIVRLPLASDGRFYRLRQR
jgi:hypothetical protein